MRKVYSASNGVEVMFWREQLQQAGIACELRNEFISGAAGELPPTECWPELWVLNERDERRARELIHSLKGKQAEPGPPWRCPNCDETVDAGFDLCWNCSTERPLTN